MAVFKRGTWKVLSGVIPKGGHIQPTIISGDSLLWKNLQKNLKKNIISLQINNINPTL